MDNSSWKTWPFEKLPVLDSMESWLGYMPESDLGFSQINRLLAIPETYTFLLEKWNTILRASLLCYSHGVVPRYLSEPLP